MLSFSMTIPWYSVSIHGLCLLAEKEQSQKQGTGVRATGTICDSEQTAFFDKTIYNTPL